VGSGKIRAGYGAKPYTLQASPVKYFYEIAPVRARGSKAYALVAAAVLYAYTAMPATLNYTPVTSGLFPSGPPGGTINYFIGPSGSDSNAGTSVAAPWAITSFVSNNSNNSKMAGKNVAFLPGLYPVVGLSGSSGGTYISNGSFSTNGSYNALSAPPGTGPSARTWIGTCDSTGNYLARTATIVLISGQVSSSTNDWFNGIFGLDGNGTNNGSGNGGYVTWDGLRINGNNMDCTGAGDGNQGAHIIMTQGPNGTFSKAGTQPGIVVINCELYGINASDSGGNDAAIFLSGTVGEIIQNNFIHDIQKPTQIDHAHAIEAYGCTGGQWIYNTFANTSGGCVESKEGGSNTTVAYNYFYNCCYTGGGNAAVCQGFDGAEGNPNTLNSGGAAAGFAIHHNIFDSCGRVTFGETNNNAHSMPVLWYSNTHYNSGEVVLNSMSSAVMAHHDNIYVLPSGSNADQVAMTNSFASPLANDSFYNVSGGSYTSVFNGVTETTGLQTGQDPLFAVGTANIIGGNGTAQFALQSTSPAAGSGTAGINRGAWDGIVTQIGCSWTKQMAPGHFGSFTRLSGGSSNYSAVRSPQYISDSAFGISGLAGYVVTSVWADWEPGTASTLGGDYTLSAYINDIQTCIDNKKVIEFKVLTYGGGSSPDGVIPAYFWNPSAPCYQTADLPCYYGANPTAGQSLWRCLYNNPFVQQQAKAFCKWILTQASFSVYVGRTFNGVSWVGGTLTNYVGFNSCPYTTLVNWDEETQPSSVGPSITANGYGTRSTDGTYYYQASTWATGYETTLAECAAYATTTQFKIPYNQLALYTVTESQQMEAAIIQNRCCQGAPDLQPSQSGGTLAPGAVPYSNEIGVAAFLGLISSNPPGLGSVPLIAEMEGDDMPGGSFYNGPTPSGTPAYQGCQWLFSFATGATVPGGDPAYTANLENGATQIWWQILPSGNVSDPGPPIGGVWHTDVLPFINSHPFPVSTYTPRIYG
jgi:hypothetical protein